MKPNKVLEILETVVDNMTGETRKEHEFVIAFQKIMKKTIKKTKKIPKSLMKMKKKTRTFKKNDA